MRPQIRRRLTLKLLRWSVPLVFVLSASCSPTPPAPPPFQPTANMKDLMLNVLDPAADGIWESVGTIMDKSGTFERFPQNDDEWAVVRMHAIQLAESGNLLLLPSRSGGSADWITQARALIDVSNRAIKTIDAKDKDALFTVGGDIYDVCTNCHKQFALETGARN
jgi:hypothetical protein